MAEDAVNPGMIIITLAPNDSALAKSCPDCHKQFKAHDAVFCSIDEAVLLHVSCVIALALVASLHNLIPADQASVYEHLRQTVLDAAAAGG